MKSDHEETDISFHVLLSWQQLFCIAVLFSSGMLIAAENPFASAVRPTDALSADEELKALHVPPGFRMQLFASEPEIQKPINMAFDGRGRLWVTTTQDYPFVNLQQPGDSIRVLEDSNGDGQADKVTVFVEGITHPMGLIPYQDGVIAFCIPNIEFFRDRDGDGKCDERQVLYGPFDYSKDTHGLNNAFRRGYDGWIYACHGFSNHSVVKGKDGNVLDVSSGGTYRFRPDGSRIERFSFGQINPFGMTFDAKGDLFNSDCHSKPLMLILRDGQYPGFGRQHDGLGFAPEVLTHSHGSTAIAGVMQTSDDRFPPEFRNNFLIGNVMTSRINRDSLAISGSSMKAIEQPDFLISDDPWFRPVDLQMGPDGALYVADFYNKIIGHYEVALNHPGRDRIRGRIWRIEPVTTEVRTLSDVADLSKMNLEDLLAAAETSNVPRQILALNEITDRLGPTVTPQLKALLKQDQTGTRRLMIQWALQRMGQLTFEEFSQGISSESELVRIHSQRTLADQLIWTEEGSTAAISRLDDASPSVQRTAAAGIAQHPAARHVRPLLERLQRVPQDDPFLEYQLKLAIRNQLRLPGLLKELPLSTFSNDQQRLLATMAMGLDNHDAAAFLLHLSRSSLADHLPAANVVGRIARWADREEAAELIKWIRAEWQSDLATQIVLLGTVREGMRKQGSPQPQEVTDWAEELIQSILTTGSHDQEWISLSLTPGGTGADWHYETRADSDGNLHQMLSSLPAGEKAVSKLRSPSFTIPSQFSFLICGHLGFPGQPVQPLNFVRLCLAADDREIARAAPPRSDVAARVNWSLQEYVGQQGYLEVVDGLDLTAYAWLSVGDVDAGVVPMPATTVQGANRRLKVAIQLANEFQLKRFRPDLEAVSADETRDLDVRSAALDAISAWERSPVIAGMAALWKVDSLTSQQRRQLQQDIVQADAQTCLQHLEQQSRTLSTREQVTIAQALLTENGGETVLLELCESGGLSPRVLASSTVRPRLEKLTDNDLRQRSEKLLKQLPSTVGEIDQQIAAISKKKAAASAVDRELGRRVFESRCATCHQVGGLGKIVGPQLDGIGSRGAERLLEDILDPNRNVDTAFRSRTYALANGKVYTGMFRRQEGALLVIADNKGTEVTFPADEVEQEVIATVSIMPDNWRELIPEGELLALLAFLEEQKKQ